jgi:hypothetical protein
MAARRSRKTKRAGKRQETASGRVERISSRGNGPIDIYHHLLTISPWALFLTGIDETVSQAVHARHTDEANEIRGNDRLADILTRAEDGRRLIDLRRFRDTVEANDSTRSEAPSRKVKA